MIPAGKGRIINLASVEGLKAHPPQMPGTVGYNATKGTGKRHALVTMCIGGGAGDRRDI
jgi:NAD(P)-dependent dehydrogenase (short-subunit alcohol dehydrogenase family)